MGSLQLQLGFVSTSTKQIPSSRVARIMKMKLQSKGCPIWGTLRILYTCQCVPLPNGPCAWGFYSLVVTPPICRLVRCHADPVEKCRGNLKSAHKSQVVCFRGAWMFATTETFPFKHQPPSGVLMFDHFRLQLKAPGGRYLAEHLRHGRPSAGLAVV